MIQADPQDVSRLIHLIDQALHENGPERMIAAFDADGTLWRGDMGEAFFDFKIEKGLVTLPPDPRGHYSHLKEHVSLRAAYLWLAQILEGKTLDQVRIWAKECVAQLQPLPVFELQIKLIEHLQKRGVEIYVVTASVAWAVEPAVSLLGLAPENVIGIRTQVVNGKITADPQGPLTFKEGKVEGLLQATKNRKPFFVSGNSQGDLALLESATHLRLVVSSALPGEENYATERKMQDIARQRNWQCYEIPSDSK